MPDALEEFARETIAELLKKLPVEERIKGLSAQELLAGLSVEERLQGFSVDELLAALPPELREALRRWANSEGS
jgi:hypothetical protein